jgi:hypothetical protein
MTLLTVVSTISFTFLHLRFTSLLLLFLEQDEVDSVYPERNRYFLISGV